MIQRQLAPEIKNSTGSAGLLIIIVTLDSAALPLTYLTGAILVPWLLPLLQWAWLLLLHRLHHDIWLFLALTLWGIGLLICGIRALFDENTISKRDSTLDFATYAGVLTILLSALCFAGEKLFGQPVTLGFIRPVTLTLFPDLKLLAQHPNHTTGLIWAFYYIAAHLYCLFWRSAPKNSVSQLPLARISPASPKDEYITQCYQHLMNALIAWDSPLIENIGWPVINYYQGNGPIFWKGRTLVVPEDLLEPAKREEFLPRLAREIAYYNGPDLWLSQVFAAYPYRLGILIITGNWLWLPGLIRTFLYPRWLGERKLWTDIFVHAAGQSDWLLHGLRKRRYELQAQHIPDTSWPPLMERIDQLEALQQIEQEQIAILGIIKVPQRLAPKTSRKKTGN